MNLLIDNNLPPRIAGALDTLTSVDGHSVVALRDRFPQNAPDELWIDELGKEGGWTILSGDRRIAKNPAQQAVIRRSGLKGFFLEPGWSKFNALEKAWRLIRWWPTLVTQNDISAEGSLFRVPINVSSRLRQFT